MTYSDFVSELKEAGLTGREFARLLHMNENTISGYKRAGTVPSHLGVIARLMRLLSEHGVEFRDELDMLSISAKAGRGRPIRLPSRDAEKATE